MKVFSWPMKLSGYLVIACAAIYVAPGTAEVAQATGAGLGARGWSIPIAVEGAAVFEIRVYLARQNADHSKGFELVSALLLLSLSAVCQLAHSNHWNPGSWLRDALSMTIPFVLAVVAVSWHREKDREMAAQAAKDAEAKAAKETAKAKPERQSKRRPAQEARE